MTKKSIINQCIALLEKQSYQEVDTLLSTFIEKEPNNPHALQLLGIAKRFLDEYELAVTLMEKSILILPRNSAVHHNIAGTYRALGKLKQAEASYRKAIELKPNYGEAYQGLSEIIRFQKGDPLLNQIKNELQKKPDEKVASYLHFSLGKIQDDCGEYSEAFKNYSKGNQLVKRKWLKKESFQIQKDITQIYSRSYFNNRPKRGLRTKIPVFIVGMPRSGSTLVEQILSSHSTVLGVGELSDIQNISQQINQFCPGEEVYPYCMNDIPTEACGGLGKAYLKRLSTFREVKNTSHTVDKNLLNFNHLGLISDLFPQANIIHIRRHPLDTCLSCFFQNFSDGIAWSFNLQSIVEFYRSYRKTMKHWQKHLPIKIRHIKYENLITNPETVSRKLLNSLELNWEQSCLDFHRNRRTVKTASVWQVRQPIYQGSKGRWQRYQEHINILTRGLADYIEEYEIELRKNSL